MAAGVGVLPSHGCAGAAIFQRLHLCCVSALFVLVIHGRSDPVANQAADRRACDSRSDPFAGPAAELGPDETAGQSPNQRSRVFLGSLSGLRSSTACGQCCRKKHGCAQTPDIHEKPPVARNCAATSAIRDAHQPVQPGNLIAKIGAKVVQSCGINEIGWQPALHGRFDPQRLFRALANLKRAVAQRRRLSAVRTRLPGSIPIASLRSGFRYRY
jgi:hypothetical protein